MEFKRWLNGDLMVTWWDIIDKWWLVETFRWFFLRGLFGIRRPASSSTVRIPFNQQMGCRGSVGSLRHISVLASFKGAVFAIWPSKTEHVGLVDINFTYFPIFISGFDHHPLIDELVYFSEGWPNHQPEKLWCWPNLIHNWSIFVSWCRAGVHVTWPRLHQQFFFFWWTL